MGSKRNGEPAGNDAARPQGRSPALKFSILNYAPNALDQPGVTIAVIVVGDGFAEARFVQDWRNILAIYPHADIELLTAIAHDIRDRLKSPHRREPLLGAMQDSWSNTLRVSPWKGCLSDDPVTEIEKLAAQHLR